MGELMKNNCETCFYCIPMATPKGVHSVCLNPDSIRIYQAVGKDNTCTAYVRNDDRR